MASDNADQLRAALRGLRTLKARVAELEAGRSGPLAIVGMAGRFPGAPDVDALWDVVSEGRRTVSPVPADRWDAAAETLPGVDRGGFLDDVWRFDAAHFRIAPVEAAAMDPQQRLVLETAWHALQDAGVADGIGGSRTGVYLGMGLSDWAQRTLRNPDPAAADAYAGTGVFHSVAAGRVAYALDLKGPALAVDTACSSSLVSVHLAAQALREGACDLAVAGGVNLLLAPDAGRVFARMGALSPTGACRSFDAACDGYVRAEAVGLVVLARLDDAVARGLRIHAVLRGSAVAQDGRSNGLTAPSGPAQEATIRAALAAAGVDPAEVVHVQTHGTGTPLGDPIEAAALRRVYGEGNRPLVLGAVKANVGHTEAAAGVTGLMAAVAALKHGVAGPIAGLATPNPHLDLGDRLVLPTATTPIEGRFAAVSSFGMSGTNAHLVLEAPPAPPEGFEAPVLTVFGGDRYTRPDPRQTTVDVPTWAVDLQPWTGVPRARRWRVLGAPGLAEALGAAPHLEGLAAGEAVVDARHLTAPDVAEALAVAQTCAAAGASWFVLADGSTVEGAAVGGLARAALAEVDGGWIDAADAPTEALVRALGSADGRDLVWRDGAWATPRWQRAAPATASPRTDGAWWVLGATGFVGRAVATWLASQGVPKLVLSSRTPASAAQVAALEAAGAEVVVAPVDATDRDALAAVVAAHAPVGVVQAVGTTRDAALAELTAADLAEVRRLKDGLARTLDALLPPTTTLWLVGSASADLGIPGQAAYGAANAAVAALAASRAGPTVLLRTGPWAGGLASDDVQARWQGRGLAPLGAADVDPVLADAVAGDHLAVRLDPERFAAAVGGPRVAGLFGLTPPRASLASGRDAVAAAVAHVLGHPDPSALDPHAGLFDLGLDSMTAVALARDLEARVGRPVPVTIAFDHGSIAGIATWLEGDVEVAADEAPTDGPIALVAIACRFPGGVRSPEDLWALMLDGPDPVGPVPAERWDVDALYDSTPGTPGRTYVREGGFLTDVAAFDAEAFGLTPREARALDPQQRLLLEVAHEATQRAAWSVDGLRGSRTGVFVGIGPSGLEHVLDPLDPDADPMVGLGHHPSFAAGRVAHHLGLRGPAVSLDTACSTALVAVHLAAQALRDGACDRALAGAVQLQLTPGGTVQLSGLKALSPTSRCHAFDAAADGYVRSEGVGVVALKRLADAERDGDPVLAVLRGSAVGHDGPAAGLTAPSGEAQVGVVRAALARAGVTPDAVGYVETHGTGTPLGDPVELGALAEVHGGRDRPLWIGATKSHVGHAEIAAGIAGLVGAVQAVRTGTVPPIRHLANPNPDLPLGPWVALPTSSAAWDDDVRIAGVSGFGLSGTNAHLVLAAPPTPVLPAVAGAQPWLVGAPSVEGVEGLADRLRALAADPASVGASLAARGGGPWRGVVVAGPKGVGPLSEVGRAVDAPPVVFLCTGQGAQHAGMTAWLDANVPVFRDVLDRVDAVVLARRGVSLREVLTDQDRLTDTAWAQPALLAMSVGLGEVAATWGLAPDAVLGHSVGGWAAAVLAGVVSLEDAAEIVCARGEAMAACPPGAMAEVRATEADVATWVEGTEVEIATLNAPDRVVVGGPTDAVDAVVADCEARDVGVTRLVVSHAFHTASMAGALAPFREALSGVRLTAPSVPVLSDLTGTTSVGDVTDPEAWVRRLRAPVRFADAVAAAPKGAVFVELGPHPVLSALVRRQRPDAVCVPLARRRGDAGAVLAAGFGLCWASGASMDPSAWWPPGTPRVAVPAAPWRMPRFPWPRRAAALASAPVWAPGWASHTPVPSDEAAETWTPPGGSRLDVLRVAVARAREAVRSSRREVWVVPEAHPALSALSALMVGLRHEDPQRAHGMVVVGAGAAEADVDAAVADPHPMLQVGADGVVARRWGEAPSMSSAPVAGTWWVTGGLGAVGRALGEALRDAGADRVVLSSRHVPSDLVLPDGIEARACDVTDPAAVAALLADLAPDGVVHAAGARDDAWLRDVGDLDVVLDAKVRGAEILSAAVDPSVRLVFVSSAAADLGWSGQAVYGAANGALDDVAAAHRAAGGAAQVVAFGPWSGGGMAEGTAAAMVSAGMRPLAPNAAVAAFLQVLGADRHRLIAAWDREVWAETSPLAAFVEAPGVPTRTRDVEGAVRGALAAALGRDDPEALDADAGLFDLGLDSLSAVDLARRMGRALGRPVPDTVVFDAATLGGLVAWAQGELVVAAPASTASTGPIAVVGLAVRAPGVETPDDLWDLLAQGRDAVGPVPPERWDASALPGAGQGGFLDEVTAFEPEAFGLTEAEAERMDPQHRLLLELAWEALEDAGIAPDALRGARVGVFVGLGGHDAQRLFERLPPGPEDAWAGTGTDPALATGRVAHRLGTQGPVVTLDTACSSSLVAIQLGVRALEAGDADLVIAGGVRLMLTPDDTVRLEALHALSPTGRCHTFDASADGYVRGEGAGLVVLQPEATALRERRRVRGLVLGAAVGHDGRSSALTAPNGAAQQRVIREALARAAVAPGDVDLVEAHGTGTPLGDPVELQALGDVHAGRERPLWVGSVKTNLGHTELAAGVLGLAKVLLALEHDAVPPHLHYATPNPTLPTNWPWQVPTEMVPWPKDHRRIAGVSAFGLGGTNAHVVVSDPDAMAPAPPSARKADVLAVSARSPEAADAAVETLRAWVAAHPEVPTADLAATLMTGRARWPHRRAMVVDAEGEIGTPVAGHVPRGATPPPSAWLFTGQGAQWAAMGADLLASFAVAREVVDRCDAVIRAEHGWSVREVLTRPTPHLDVDQTWVTQPAIYALQVAQAAVWRQLGHAPDVVVGHSVGELAAATVAGVWDLEDGARLAAARGRLMADLPDRSDDAPAGAMAAVRADATRVTSWLADGAVIAARNAPDETVVSGDAAAVDAVVARAETEGVAARRLAVSAAFHSPHMDGVPARLTEVAAGLRLHRPSVPFVSPVTGGRVDQDLTDPAWWGAQSRAEVRFAEAVAAVVDEGIGVAVEIGPHPVLSGLGARTRPEAPVRWLASARRGERGLQTMAGAVATWVAQVDDLDGVAWDDGVVRPVVDAPRVPWARRTVWPAALRAAAAPSVPRLAATWGPAGQSTVAGPWRVEGPEAGTWGAAIPGAPDAEAVVWCGDVASPEAAVAVVQGLRGRGAVHLVVPETPGGAALEAVALTLALEDPSAFGGVVRVASPDPATVAAAVGASEDVQRVHGDRREALRWAPGASARPGAWSGPVLITGGTGALGRALARRLVAGGATVVAVSRRGVEAWPDAPAGVSVRRLDVTDADAVTALLADLQPGAVVHAAGVLADHRLEALTAEDAATVAAPKVAPLAALVAGTSGPVVVLSSATARLGAPGQAAYGAANAWAAAVDGVVGLDLGPVEGTELAADHLDAMRARGIRPLALPVAVEAIAQALGGVGGLVADADWPAWRAAVEGARPRTMLDRLAPVAVASTPTAPPTHDVPRIAREVVEAILGGPAATEAPDAGFFDLGMDSLLATQLATQLAQRLGQHVPSTVAFDHPTLAKLTAHLARVPDAPIAASVPAADIGPLAIVGLACRYPGAEGPDALWDLLKAGRDVVSDGPPDRWPDAARWLGTGEGATTPTLAGAYLDDIASFDPLAFGLSVREAEAMDPQHRLALALASDAVEDAAIDPAAGRVGVFVGIGPSEYDDRFAEPGTPYDAHAGTGNDPSFAAGRIAHVLGTTGPAASVTTACSSGLVALHMAAEAVANGDCEAAVVGAVNLLVDPRSHVRLAALRALSPTGRCRAFSADADGYVRADGGAALVVMPLDAAQSKGLRVHAVLAGTAVGHDGRAAGLTVPSGPAQEAVVRAAWARAGVGPDDVGFVEAHGTGTTLGDPIEAGALARVSAGRSSPLPIGSVKSVLGHTEVAAGLTGLLKAVLALREGWIPPHLHVGTVHPDVAALPLDVVVEGRPWTGPRVAGVSSFGLSGTNAHAVVRAAPDAPTEAPVPEVVWTPLAAQTEAGLEALAQEVGASSARVADVATTIAGRGPRRFRRAVVTSSDAPPWSVDGVATAAPGVVALCPGGRGWAGWGPLAARWPLSAVMDEVAQAAGRPDLLVAWTEGVEADHADADLVRVLGTVVAGRAWEALGVPFAGVVGHGLGEIAAGVLAGALSIPQAVAWVQARRAVSDGAPPLRRVALRLPAGARAGFAAAHPGVVVVSEDGPDEVVVAGPADAVDAALAVLDGVLERELPAGDAAHTRWAVLDGLQGPDAVAPTMRWASGATAQVETTRWTDPAAWVADLAAPVRWADAVGAVVQPGDAVVELGDDARLAGPTRRALRDVDLAALVSMARPARPEATFAEAQAQLWARGVSFDAEALATQAGGRRVALPTTPRQPRRCWVDPMPTDPPTPAQVDSPPATPLKGVDTWIPWVIAVLAAAAAIASWTL